LANTEAMLVDEMVQTPGWKLVEAWLNGEISRYCQRLEGVNPDDAAKVSAAQATIRSYRYLLSTIDNMRKQV
jgi:hypothetical protein